MGSYQLQPFDRPGGSGASRRSSFRARAVDMDAAGLGRLIDTGTPERAFGAGACCAEGHVSTVTTVRRERGLEGGRAPAATALDSEPRRSERRTLLVTRRRPNSLRPCT
jgi:hypothetical protein